MSVFGPVKFNRNYNLAVNDSQQSTHVFTPPTTIEFDITRHTYSETNTSQVRLYNLSATNRTALQYDFSNIVNKNPLFLTAGYGLNMNLIFFGTVSECYSVRQGTNFITTIESYDGIYPCLKTIVPPGFSVYKGQTMASVFLQLIALMAPYVLPGFISPYFNTVIVPRSHPIKGHVWDLLTELSGGAFHVDSGIANIVRDGDTVPSTTVMVQSSTGLLNTPTRENQIITLDVEFEPGLIPGQYVYVNTLQANLNSFSYNSAAKNVNGPYKISQIRHHGTISPAVCGECITSLTLFTNNGALTPL